MANILSSITAQTPITAELSGTGGTIFLDKPWYKGSSVRIERTGQPMETISLPYGDNGFEFQIQEVQHCLAKGLRESDKMPLSFSLLLSDVMDDISRMGNIRYEVQR